MKTLITIALLSLTLLAQERVLLRIGPNGQQEAIPLKKGEHAQEVIERLENQRTSMVSPDNSAGLVDTLKYFTSESELTTNFGWVHQDVAMQWFSPQSSGTVKEFWWLNYLNRGVINKGTIRAWLIDPRVANLPASPPTKYIGTYKSPSDGDGGVQPFKPATGNQWFYSNGEADSVTYSFDLFTKEAAWLEGGLQVKLDSNKWQGIRLSDWGDSMNVALGQLFGFTLSNDTRKEDFGSGVDTRMEILTKISPGLPYHSYKYYETGRTAPANAGWHMRGDYEWGMYVVIEYTTCRAPKLTFAQSLGTTLSTLPRKICVTVSGFDCNSIPDTTLTLGFYSKKGRASMYDSVFVNSDTGTYCFELPAALKGDTIYFYFAAYNDYVRVVSPVRSYIIFSPQNTKLFIHNNSRYPSGSSKLIYTGSNTAPGFDYWSTPNDGMGEMQDLLTHYDKVLIADGSFPSRYVYPYIKQWLAGSTLEKKKYLFFTSQDYGCFIQGSCSDSSFSSGTWEYDYLGLEKLGPQDLLPSNREHRIIPMQDTVTNYLIRFQKDSNTTLWSDPTFELGFAGYMDAMMPRPEAKVLFREGKDSLPVGIIHRTDKFTSLYLGFDAGALSFYHDSTMWGRDKSWWINNVKSLSAAFFESLITDVNDSDNEFPEQFSLAQNFPNPFNPTTAIEYRVASRSIITISIYNLLGQKVATLVNESKDPGSYRAEWNASRIASGLYFYEMRAGNYTSVKKMLLLK